MRVIGGLWKGRKLKARVPVGVRPTVDAMRETLFNIINNHFEYDDARVLDLCAGTGALGIEAMSRGAANTLFVEQSKSSIRALSDNLSGLAVDHYRYQIVQSDAVKFLEKHSANDHSPFDLIFADPPYAQRMITTILGLVAQNKVLSERGILIVEHAPYEVPIVPEDLELITSRAFGESVLDFLRWKTTK